MIKTTQNAPPAATTSSSSRAAAPAAPKAQPAPAPVARRFTADEVSRGVGRALRERATALLGSTGLRTPPKTDPAASNLLSENADDAQVNCLDAANDYLERLPPDRRAQADVVFLRDTRPGVEGSAGHVLVREGGRFVDPLSGNSYASLQQFDPDHAYQPVGTLAGPAVVDVLNTKPGSSERAAAIAQAGVSPAVAAMMVADGPRFPETAWVMRVSDYQGYPGSLRAGANKDASVVATLPVGTEFQVLETVGAWRHVRTADGQEGWIAASRTEHVSGVATGTPYVLDDGRDGSAASAVAHAEGLVGGGTGYVNTKTGETFCLSFVQDCYGLKGAFDRCPEMYDPSPYSGSADGAWHALSDAGKVVASNDMTTPLPAGAMVFFGPSAANAQWGHVAIATGEMAPDGTPYVITSGWGSSPEVKLMSLKELEHNEHLDSDTATKDQVLYLGYTTPELAFSPGTWGGGAVDTSGD